MVDFNLHQSVVNLHPMFSVFGAGIFHGGVDARQLVYVLVVIIGSLQYGDEMAQG